MNLLNKYNNKQIEIIKQFKMKSQSKPSYDYKIDNIYNDYFKKIDLKNKNILELGPSQCHFLRLMKKQNANTFGIDSDKNVKILAETFDIKNIDINDYSKSIYFNYDKYFDIIFCKNSININSIDEQFLINIDKIVKTESYIFIIPWFLKYSDDFKNIFELVKKYNYTIINLSDTKYTYTYDKNTVFGYIFIRNTLNNTIY
jgi:hypothetical protein